MLLILAGLSFPLLRSASTTVTATSTSAGMTSVIVELRDDPAAVYKAKSVKSGVAVSDEGLESYRNRLSAKQDEFLKALAASGIQYAVRSQDIKNFDGTSAGKIEFRYTLVYNGLAMSVPKSAVASIAAMPEVKRVSPDDVLRPMLNKSVGYIHAPQVYGDTQELTQFDIAGDGYEGQNMYVSIIDSGVDWTHPMFGNDPNPPRLGVAPVSSAVTTNQKVVYYLPLADSVIEDAFGHGTHVASTTAGYYAKAPGADGIPGTADDVGLHGVAPQAKIMAYKVCSDTISTVDQVQSVGGCLGSNTMLALEDSVSRVTKTGFQKPVADVINMSLGGSGGPDNPTAVAASNAALAGTTVVAASGNAGPDEGTTGSPAAGTHVISVGATTHPGAPSLWSTDMLQADTVSATQLGAVTPANNLPTAPGFARVKLYPMSGTAPLPEGGIAQHYVYVSDVLDPWPLSVRGRIVLTKAAIGATIFDVAAQAYAAGAVGLILFDDRGTLTAVKTLMPAASVLPEDGEILVDDLLSNDDNDKEPPSGTISEYPIRMNPTLTPTFMGEMGDFSSRGPVQGLGQIKPDVSAPGVKVLAAVPPASLLGALATALEGTPNYFHSDGTSMASPHVAGAAVLTKQAHRNWTPDMIRTAFINTATNMRDSNGTPKADGPGTADSILDQGGGLIDVKEAINAKALMGVTGDGINKPGILGSHSFGAVPVINNRTTHTESVTVTIRDLSGQGGTYNLSVANNRLLEKNGITASVSPQSVTVPAGGTATFRVNATVDGNIIRDVTQALQMQWYVLANSADESLRMPFYMKLIATAPAGAASLEQLNYADTVLAPDGGTQLVGGVTYQDHTFKADTPGAQLNVDLNWEMTVDGAAPDLDLYLIGPDGEDVTNSGVPGGPEHISTSLGAPGTYTLRVAGFANGPTDYTMTGTVSKGIAAPVLQAIAGEFTDAQSRAVDFDGSYTISWQPDRSANEFEIEHSTDGVNYQVIGQVDGTVTSQTFTDQANGTHSYRVRSLSAGQIGFYVTPPSNPQSIVVDKRTIVDITTQVQRVLREGSVSFSGGVAKYDLGLRNISTTTYFPMVEMRIVGITTDSGLDTVSVKNAENGGNGKSVATAALFGYSNLLGTDQAWSGGEVTGARSLEFNDSTADTFSFKIVVTAYQGGAGAPVTSSSSSAGGGGAGASPTSGSSASGLPVKLTRVLSITINPLTKTVTSKLL
ncbi:MAG TPA: S8 family serine peptidase [Pyrinomonadaceae bacterium]|nr:S8 family serine peptidase [Pyrinomonadaceae bacterium]